ncbi:putative E3 ubiquitin-protein ligase MGRN1 isoform X2 [Glandiceps talaboti]
MGNLTSVQSAGVEELDIAANSAYRYPPKSGCYFGSHFMMGGQRFETAQPEAYLFGENSDLNFLGSRPAPFPYPAPQSNEPTKTLKSLINIRKDSLRLVKENRCLADDEVPEDLPSNQYTIEFTFDSEAKVGITFHYFASEDITNGKIVYTSRDPIQTSETFHFKRGANQQFSQASYVIDPSKFNENEFNYDPLKDSIPFVIQCNVEEPGEEFSGHSHILFAAFEKTVDGFALKPLKQKQMVDGVCYLLQEIYGIENKNALESNKLLEDDYLDDNGSECVICMCDLRDTLILPCRHLCLCSGCADSLRYQSSCCPICRAPFRALLQIRALRKKSSTTPTPDTEDNGVSQENLPPGYEAIPLGEALNGPQPVPPQPPTLAAEGGQRAVRGDIANEGRTRRGRRKPSHGGSSLGSNSLRGSAVLEEAEECKEENEVLSRKDIQPRLQNHTSNPLILPVPVEKPATSKKEKPRKLSLPTPTSPPYSSPVISPLSNTRSETTPEPLSEDVSDCPSCRNSDESLIKGAPRKPVTEVTPVTLFSEKNCVNGDVKSNVRSPVSDKNDMPVKLGKGDDRFDDVLDPDDAEDDDEMPYEEDVYSRDGCDDTDSLSTNPGAGIVYDEKPQDENSSLMEASRQGLCVDVELPGTPMSSSDSNRESSGSYSSTSSMRMLLSTPSHIKLEESSSSDKS